MHERNLADITNENWVRHPPVDTLEKYIYSEADLENKLGTVKKDLERADREKTYLKENSKELEGMIEKLTTDKISQQREISEIKIAHQKEISALRLQLDDSKKETTTIKNMFEKSHKQKQALIADKEKLKADLNEVTMAHEALKKEMEVENLL